MYCLYTIWQKFYLFNFYTIFCKDYQCKSHQKSPVIFYFLKTSFIIFNHTQNVNANIKIGCFQACFWCLPLRCITRPRENFVTMKKNSKYFKRILSGRVIKTGLHNYYKLIDKPLKSKINALANVTHSRLLCTVGSRGVSP